MTGTWPRVGPVYVVRWRSSRGWSAHRFYFQRRWAEERAAHLRAVGFEVEMYVSSTYWKPVTERRPDRRRP